MRKLVFIFSFILLVSIGLFAQTSERESDNKFEGEEFTKTQLSPKTVELAPLITNSYVEELSTKLQIAKKDGDEVEARRIEQELKKHTIKAKQKKVDSSRIRKWYQATDIEIEYDDNSDSDERWENDIIVDGSTNNQKAPSMAVRYQNGDIYIAYEDYNYPSVRIHIKKSTNGGLSWDDEYTLYSSAGDDFFFPCIAIGEGNQNKLFVSFYTSSEEVIVFWEDLNSGEYDFVYVQTTGENIRPMITVDTDSYYYIYVTWVEEDWPSGDDLYYSRSTDYGVTFCDGVNILGGAKQNVDIGWGFNHLYIVYQGDDLPGRIYIIENSPYGNPLTWPNSGYLITNENSYLYLYPRIAVSDHSNLLCIVYTFCYSDTDYDIFCSSYDGIYWDIDYCIEGGGEWESLADIMYMPSSSAGDNFHLAYYDDGWIIYRKTDDPTDWGTWNYTYISDSDNASDDDFVAVSANSNNEGMVAWAAWISGDLDILFDAEYMPVSTDENEITSSFAFLSQNFPNPFNPSGAGRSPETTIEYSIKEDSNVLIEIFNTKGQKVKTLIDDFRDAGYHTVIWNGKDNQNKPVSSGLYFYRLKSNSFSQIRKMLLLK